MRPHPFGGQPRHGAANLANDALEGEGGVVERHVGTVIPADGVGKGLSLVDEALPVARVGPPEFVRLEDEDLVVRDVAAGT
eukprot:8923991-Alexandrium_andersonii.AAC.1